MANKLYQTIQQAPLTGGNDIIFTSDKKQMVFLLLWNNTNKQIKFLLNNKEEIISDCGEILQDAHRMEILYLNAQDSIALSTTEENQIKYNIII